GLVVGFAVGFSLGTSGGSLLGAKLGSGLPALSLGSGVAAGSTVAEGAFVAGASVTEPSFVEGASALFPFALHPTTINESTIMIATALERLFILFYSLSI
ncbi:hypothetical protein AB4Z21_29460, partial [Paenibacillus sp. MCAF20]